MSDDIAIRRYKPSDREVIKQITIEGFQGVSIDQNIERRFGTVAGRDWRYRKARQIDEDIDAPNGVVLVAEHLPSGEAVGYITTRLNRDTGIGWIPNLAVRRDMQGRGIGRRLIEAALELFRSEGLAMAKIETLEQNPVGQHLYPKCGFVEVARQIHYVMPLREPADRRGNG